MSATKSCKHAFRCEFPKFPVGFDFSGGIRVGILDDNKKMPENSGFRASFYRFILIDHILHLV